MERNDLEALKQAIVSNEIKAVLCNRMPQGKIYETIIQSGAQPVVLTTLITANAVHLEPMQRLLHLYSSNLDAILKGLK